MKKRTRIIKFTFLLFVFLFVAFLAAYRYVGVGGRVTKIDASYDKGFYTEYYLFVPDTMKALDSTFLLVEPNNTGFVDDSHKSHVDAAYNIIRFGQANRIARELGIPLLVPCFDRPASDWERYTHALDRDTLLYSEGEFNRIDQQLLAMIEDSSHLLADKGIQIQDKILMNGFSASGSFVNRFTALYPEKVAAVAAGGINSMVILPVRSMYDLELIYPVGVADIEDIANIDFQLQRFASVPQYYYMGDADKNDSLPYDDAYSRLEREIIIEVLGQDMNARWENCKKLYEGQLIQAQFITYHGVGHETTAEINADIVSFFAQVIGSI